MTKKQAQDQSEAIIAAEELKQRTIRADAHLWRTTLDDEPSEAERAEFAAWLAEDSRHRSAFERAGAVWSLTGEVERAAAAVKPARRGLRQPLWLAAASLLITAAALFLVLRPSAPPTAAQQVVTLTAPPGELLTTTLADQSSVTLGGDSALRVILTVTARRAVLLRGDAFFDITHDPERPFTVSAGPAQVRVLGTQFAVESRGSRTLVAVAEGSVRVATDGNRQDRSGGAQSALSSAAADLSAGLGITVDRHSGVGAPRTLDPNDIAAWRDGRLVFVSAPLLEVVKALNRYDQRTLYLDPSPLAQEPVTATLRIDEFDANVALLAATFDLTIDEFKAGHLNLKARE
ncbi:MAG: FecR domain-containing protein [Pseudomonadota bacterium]